MKILVISNLFPPHFVGGYELHCAATVNAMRSRGHDVQVLTSNHRVVQTVDIADSKVERSLRIHGYFGHPWLGIRQLQELEQHNNRLVRDAIAKFQPDVVYVWNLGGLSKSIIFTLERLRVPTAFYVSDHWIARSLGADVWLNWWNRTRLASSSGVLRLAYGMLGLRAKMDAIAPTNPASSAKFHRIAFCSKALRNLTQRNGYDVSHGDVIYSPVNIDSYTGEPAPASKPMRRLLYVGRLSEDKGVLTTLRAMALVKTRFNGSLSLYGKGEPEYVKMLQDFIQRESLPVTIHSAGPAEMPVVYREHDALLFPSEWEEPFAITPLEAMASGLPVIATMTGGSSELFRHGVNSFTYDAGDAVMLAERILELDGHPTLRTQIARAGQADVRRLCSETVIMDQEEAFLLKTVLAWEQTEETNALQHQVRVTNDLASAA